MQELLKKRDKTIKIGLNDASPKLLEAIQGGTTLNVLSKPQRYSVTRETFDKAVFSRNLYDKTTVARNTYVHQNTGLIGG